jgi:two-component system chemotaxis response regulator CheY
MAHPGSGPVLWEIRTQVLRRAGSGVLLAAAARLGYSEWPMPRILVVEDSASTRAFVRTTLESEEGVVGVEVSEATSGFDALRLLPRGPYDLVITDINMPDINGLELVQFMRKSEQHRHTPILLISTQSSERDRQRGLKLGANGYLAKPFGATALVADVSRLLAGRGGDQHD